MVLSRLLRAGEGKRVKRLKHIADSVNSFEDDVKPLSDAQLRAKTDEFRERHAKGESLDELLPEAFAVAREAARRVLGQRACTALGPTAIAGLRFGRFHRSPGMAAQVPVRSAGLTVTDAAFVARAHRFGLPVHVWTIDDPAEMHRLLDLGVDGLMTDRPTVLREVLIERNAWFG